MQDVGDERVWDRNIYCRCSATGPNLGQRSRFMGSEASEVEFEELFLELPDRIAEVTAPTHWTGARLEAWLDWAEGETDMGEAVAQFVEGLTARAQAAGLVKDVRARTRFRDNLTEAL